MTSLGQYNPVAPAHVREGDVIFSFGKPYTVVSRQPRTRNGNAGFSLEGLRDHSRKQLWCSPEEPLYRLCLPLLSSGPTEGWRMSQGDVVIYPGSSGRIVAAIRHSAGWYATSGIRTTQPDARIFWDVHHGRALLIRDARTRTDLTMPCPYRIGTVIALRSRKVPDPTVWVRTGFDLWSSSSGVEVSDLMVTFEMRRKTYTPLWIPGR